VIHVRGGPVQGQTLDGAAVDSGGRCFAPPRGGENPAMSDHPEEVDESGRNPTQRRLDEEGRDTEQPVAPEPAEREAESADERPLS
jgi:hypothetical protein